MNDFVIVGCRETAYDFLIVLLFGLSSDGNHHISYTDDIVWIQLVFFIVERSVIEQGCLPRISPEVVGATRTYVDTSARTTIACYLTSRPHRLRRRR